MKLVNQTKDCRVVEIKVNNFRLPGDNVNNYKTFSNLILDSNLKRKKKAVSHA